jgi:hypothetical protein
VARLIRAAGFCGRTPRRWKPTTIPDPAAAARALVQVVGDGMGASIQALLGQVLVQLDDLVLNRSAASSAIRSPGASISASRWRTSIPRRPAPPGPPSAGCREPDSASEARDRRRANDRHRDASASPPPAQRLLWHQHGRSMTVTVSAAVTAQAPPPAAPTRPWRPVLPAQPS